MDQGLITKRYAKALIEYATEKGEADLLYRTMLELADRLVGIPMLRRTLDNPMVDKQSKLTLIAESVGDNAPQSYRDFANLVLDNHREKYLHNMALSYALLYREVNNISVVKLTSATPMSDAMLERIRSMVAAKTHGVVEFENRTDPSIEGGFVFQIDDLRLDASVRGQLEYVRRQFIRNNRVIV